MITEKIEKPENFEIGKPVDLNLKMKLNPEILKFIECDDRKSMKDKYEYLKGI